MVVTEPPIEFIVPAEPDPTPPERETVASATPPRWPVGLLRVRIAVITAMLAVVAVAAGGIFDQRIWWLLVSPALVGASALTFVRQLWPVRLVTSTLAVLASTSAIVIAVGGTGGDIASALVAGPQQLLTTDWPSPDLAELVGTVSLVIGVITALAALLARRTDLHLAPLAPVVAAYVAVIALSAPLGAQVRWLLPLAALAIAFAALRPGNDQQLSDRITALRGEHRLIPVSIIVIGLTALLAVPVTLIDRADPRRNEPAERSAALIDPIEATLALQALEPAEDLHVVTIDGDVVPMRWRTTALVDYDGGRWAPDLTLRPIGRRLDGDTGDAVSATISFLDANLQLVPLPGAAVVVDAPIETDAARNIVRLTGRPSIGDDIDIVARVEPDVNASGSGQVATLEIDENASSLTDFAATLAEQGGASAADDVFTRLRAIETTLAEDYTLRSDASGGGLQRALIDRFLRDTRRGNAEQFSTAFVLLARSLGVDARVATGFVVSSDRVAAADGATRITLSSSDAQVWAEVRIDDAWVAFDPVPDSEATDATPPSEEPQEQTPAAAQPPIDPPPESGDEPVVTQTDTDDTEQTGLPAVLTWALRVGVGAAVLIVPALLLVLLVLGVKWRRRRRRLTGSAHERIHGAWSVATNRLVDAGMTIDASDTNAEIVEEATPYLDDSHRELSRLATLANTATFGSPARPDLLADDAAFCLDEVERSMAESRTLYQRAVWSLNVRSLRRSTRSPV